MANILPENPPTVLPTPVLKTFKALKSLPDTYFIWHHLAPWEPNAPDFLIVNQDQKVLLVKVSSSTDIDATPATQLLLIDDPRPKLGKKEALVLEDFLKSLKPPDSFPVETLIIFPNIRNNTLSESRLECKKGEPQWVGCEILQEDATSSWEALFPSKSIDNVWFHKLRRRFTPEIVVPPELTARSPRPHQIQAGLTDFLLDYDQEAALKIDLDLEPDGYQLSSDFRLNIINGVAGSGKTLILLYRLRLLYHLYPEKKFLVLTHNKPLRKDLESRFCRLEGHLPNNIEWHTFFSWCYHLWPKQPSWVGPISQQRKENIIQQVWTKYLKETSITEFMLQAEIDWIKDQIPIDEEQYLNIDRRGRGFGLSADQRQQMWHAFTDYENQLGQLGKPDWGDIPQQLWKFQEGNIITLPKYDAILIDETQFFAPLWIDLVKKSLRTNYSHLFLVADPTQGFLGRSSTWKSMGIEARGRTHKLKRSYRTTQEIMAFATLFYRLRLPDEKDEDILAPNLLDMPNGAFPQIILLDSAQDEIARVANEIEAFLQQGVPRRDLYILHANWQGAEALIDAINHRLGNATAMEPKDTYPGNYVRVTTISAGPGLESPIVFLVGLRTLFEEEQSLRIGDDERMEIIKTNTRKIFMAATRASQRLVFTYVGDLPRDLQYVFKLNENTPSTHT